MWRHSSWVNLCTVHTDTRSTHTVTDVNTLVKHTDVNPGTNGNIHTHIHCRLCTDRQLASPAGMGLDRGSVPISVWCCLTVRWSHWNGGRRGREGGRGRRKWRQSRSERKVKQIDLLSWIRDLTADGPQSLEAVPDGMDVGHSHEHHLAVGVVL